VTVPVGGPGPARGDDAAGRSALVQRRAICCCGKWNIRLSLLATADYSLNGQLYRSLSDTLQTAHLTHNWIRFNSVYRQEAARLLNRFSSGNGIFESCVR
jgi:hypothetical protein